MDTTALFTRVKHCLPGCCGMLLASVSLAQPPLPSEQDHQTLRKTAEQFLHHQTDGMPGKVSITVGPIDARRRVAACRAPQAFLPGGSQAWGKTIVGVRCTGPATWTIYIQARVRITGDYYTAAMPLLQGHSLEPADLVKSSGDLTSLPPGVITDPTQAVGRLLARSVAAGTPLRQDLLRSPRVVQQGQTVRIVVHGPGFSMANEGRALGNASEGQRVQVRTMSGQIVSGLAQQEGVVMVAF